MSRGKSPLLEGQRDIFILGSNRAFLSPLQRCDSLILSQILSHSSKPDLARTAPLYRAWLSESRRALYADLTFDANAHHAYSLAAALHATPAIRNYVRRLTIYHSPHPEPTIHYGWLALLPAHGLHSIAISQELPDPPFTDLVLSAPALATARRLALLRHTLTVGAPLQPLAAHPTLTDLALELNHPTSPVDPATVAPLVRLSAVAHQDFPVLSALVTGACGSLVHLDLYIAHWRDAPALQGALAQAARLRHLAVRTPSRPPSPFLDDVVPGLVHLVSLCCGQGTYSARLLRTLPVGLRTFQLEEARGNTDFPLDDMLAMINQVRTGQLFLRRLRIIGIGITVVDRIREACYEADIDFSSSDYNFTDILARLL